MRRTVTAIFVAAIQYRSWIDRHAVVSKREGPGRTVVSRNCNIGDASSIASTGRRSTPAPSVNSS